MLNQNKHRNIMFQILNEIYSSKFKDILAFKGGTLAFFLYNLPRFSTDLDFDIIKSYPNLMPELKEIIQKFGKIKDEQEKFYTYLFLIDYGTGENNLKIEINKRIYKDTKYEVVNFFGKPILAMDKQSIFAHKLIALSKRFKNRDLFDTHFFFENNFPVDKNIIKEGTGLDYIDFLANLSKNLPKYFKSNTVLAEIGDLISDKQKNFMKTKMLNEVLNYIEFEKFNSIK